MRFLEPLDPAVQRAEVLRVENLDGRCEAAVNAGGLCGRDPASGRGGHTGVAPRGSDGEEEAEEVDTAAIAERSRDRPRLAPAKVDLAQERGEDGVERLRGVGGRGGVRDTEISAEAYGLKLGKDGEDGGDGVHGPETGGEVTTVARGGPSYPRIFFLVS